MSHDPNRENSEGDGSDERQEPLPSWPATPSAGTGGYPYPPEPWGPPDAPTPPPTSEQAAGQQRTNPQWPPPTQWSPPSDPGTTQHLPSGGSDAGYGGTGYGSTGHGSTAYGSASGYPGPGGYGAGYPGGPGYVQSPEQSSARAQGIVSLVLNLISVLTCCNVLGIVGAILAGISLGRVDSDLPNARNLIKWSWILFGAGLVLGALAVAVYLGVVVAAGAGSGF